MGVTGTRGLPRRQKEVFVSCFVSPEGVFVGQSIDTREEMLRFIADRAAELGAADSADAVFEALSAREEMGETGMTDGFAVPHAKDRAITRATVIVVKNDRPIEWPSFDDKPIDVAISLLVPGGEEGTAHIRLLSRTAVLLMKDEFKRAMRETDDPQGVADVINAGLEEE